MNKRILDFVMWATNDGSHNLNTFNKLRDKIYNLLEVVYDGKEAKKFTNLIMNNLNKLVEFKQVFVYNCYEVSFKVNDIEITFYCADKFL